jgi:hypothetical protein
MIKTGTDAVIEEATLTLNTPTKMGLVVMKSLLADRPHLPHDVFEVTSATLNQS